MTKNLLFYFSVSLNSRDVTTLIFSVLLAKDKFTCRNGNSDKNSRQYFSASKIRFSSVSP